MTKLEQFYQMFPLVHRRRLLKLEAKVNQTEADAREEMALVGQQMKALNALGIFDGLGHEDDVQLLVELGFVRDERGDLDSVKDPPTVQNPCPRCKQYHLVLLKLRKCIEEELGQAEEAPVVVSKSELTTRATELQKTGLSHREIASKLGVSHATVHRALKGELM